LKIRILLCSIATIFDGLLQGEVSRPVAPGSVAFTARRPGSLFPARQCAGRAPGNPCRKPFLPVNAWKQPRNLRCKMDKFVAFERAGNLSFLRNQLMLAGVVSQWPFVGLFDWALALSASLLSTPTKVASLFGPFALSSSTTQHVLIFFGRPRRLSRKEKSRRPWGLSSDFCGLNYVGPGGLFIFRTNHMLSRPGSIFVPARGEPLKFVPQIEPSRPSTIPAWGVLPERPTYLRWHEAWRRARRFAVRGSPTGGHGNMCPENANLRYLAKWTPGTHRTVQAPRAPPRFLRVISITFEACWDDEQWAHGISERPGIRGGVSTRPSASFAANCAFSRGAVRETEVQQCNHGLFSSPQPGHRSSTDWSCVGPHTATRTNAPEMWRDAPIKPRRFCSLVICGRK